MCFRFQRFIQDPLYIYIYIYTHFQKRCNLNINYTWIYKPFVFSSKRENKRCLHFIYFSNSNVFENGCIHIYLWIKNVYFTLSLEGHLEQVVIQFYAVQQPTLTDQWMVHSVSSTLPLCDCFKSYPRFVFDMVNVGQFCNWWIRYCVFSMTSMTGTVSSQLRFDG